MNILAFQVYFQNGKIIVLFAILMYKFYKRESLIFF